jgi:SNF2 family DNA or RNA helicase
MATLIEKKFKEYIDILRSINSVKYNDDNLENNIEVDITDINNIEIMIINELIDKILQNTPETGNTILTFNNIKTTLYDYQKNNVNWMHQIENKNYSEDYDELEKIIKFNGGALLDQVGMGKTLQIITLININPSKIDNIVYNEKLYSKATLIIAPNHLCGQWLREFEKHTYKSLNILSLITKVQFKKYTYFDYSKYDVIIISANYFKNCGLNPSNKVNPNEIVKNILNKNVNLFEIYWHRVVIDEYHEYEKDDLFYKLQFLSSNYRWILSGTPFQQYSVYNKYIIENSNVYDIRQNKTYRNRIINNNNLSNEESFINSSLSKIIDYLTHKKDIVNTIDFKNLNIFNYILLHFSRNTHDKNLDVLKLPDIKESVIKLKFSDTERMMYNSYLSNHDNKADDIFLRKICCHPTLVEGLKMNEMSTLDNMHDYIKKMYLSEFEVAQHRYNDILERIQESKDDIEELKKINDDKSEKKIIERNITLLNRIEKEKELLIIKNNKEQPVLYYRNFMKMIENTENIITQQCPICFCEIDENDIGITICCHLYCYSCINSVIKSSKTSNTSSICPICKKGIDVSKIFLISKNISKDVNKYGTKISYIIDYIKNTSNRYRIIFSQWNHLLKEVGKILEENNIKILYCKGSAYQKNHVLNLFNNENENNEYKILMLSSETTASGSNLSNAEEVIFLDPVYGDIGHRKNVENQAIGRVRRLGNKFKEINVVKIIISDTIEETIYNSNKDDK